MENQEDFIKLQMIQQQASQLEQKLQVFDEQIQEMQAIKASLEGLDKNKDNKGEKEILANLGKGIFIKTEVKDDNLFVNVGKETLVKKSIGETIKVLEDQVGHLSLGKEHVVEAIGKLQNEMLMMIQQAEAKNKSKDNSKKKEDKEK